MDWFAWLLALALKAMIVLGGAWTATRALRKGSAAARHLVWTGAFAGLLFIAGAALYRSEVVIPAKGAADAELAAAPAKGVPVEAQARPAPPWAAWVVGVWFAGAILVTARLLFSLLIVDGLAVRPALESDWYERLQRLRRALGIRRNVELLVSPEAPMPMTWGAIRPVVILPSSAVRWTGERLELVLLHELAHVKRWDWLTQLAAHLACAVYWFMPPCWSALNEFRKERERACDDVVLRLGARATEYAEHLVQVARTMQRLSWSTALAMAQESHLANRVTAMLDPHTERRALQKRWLAVSGLLAVALFTPLAAISLDDPEVQGTVFDASGAVIPGAGVALIGEGFRYTTQTGPDGAFQLHGVTRGRYELQAMHPGFRRFRHGALVLDAGSTYRIEPTLQIGAIRESLRVHAQFSE
jgi:beta-lactamase regulating signal transducer with metallopeptidase domain